MAVLESASYQGRKFIFTVEQSGTSTAFNWSFEVTGGTSNYYDTSPISCKIGDYEVASYPQTNWDTYKFPAKKGTESGTYDPGYYGTFTLTLSGRPYYHSATTVTGSITTVNPYTKYSISSWSASLAASILYLKSTVAINITQGTNSIAYIENEIGVSNDNIVKQHTFHTGGSYNGSDSLTATGAEINNTTGLGQPLYSNIEVSDGVNADELYSSERFTAPTNLMTAPSVNGSVAVIGVSQNNVIISTPNVTNWVRNEGQAYYAYALQWSDGSTWYNFWTRYQQSQFNPGQLTIPIAQSQTWGDLTLDPSTETISAGTGAAYTMNRGQVLTVRPMVVTKYLGVRLTGTGSSSNIYFPKTVTLTKNGFNYNWVNENGRIYLVLNSANIAIGNADNETLGNKYISMNANKVLASNVSGDIWTTDTSNTNLKSEYRNSAISGTSYAWLYYATNYYAENIITPVSVTDNWSQVAGLISCNRANANLSTAGLLSNLSCTVQLPTSLVLGQVPVKLQISKNSDFTTITHTETVTIDESTNSKVVNFSNIQLGSADLGTNYYRYIFDLPNSSTYYNVDSVLSSVGSFEFTGVPPKIDSFTARIDANTNTIKVTISESTGNPTPDLYIDVYRTTGGANYATFQVQNGVEYELPYNEPGTIWYLRSRAVNALGTVYGLEDDDVTIKEIALQLFYQTTDDYEEVAVPTVSANKVQLDGTCTMTFTWTNLVTDLYDVKYNIIMESSQLIVPIRHEDKTSGYTYTFQGRQAHENVSFMLEVCGYNSFGDEVVSYQIPSNEVELEAVELNNISYTYDAITTYHSIEFDLTSINKNNNKLVYMKVGLYDIENESWVRQDEIGDLHPTAQSQDLNPIDNDIFDNLISNHTYRLDIYTLGMNPIDSSITVENAQTSNITTNEFNVYPVRNVITTITNQIEGMPTVNSNIQMTWTAPLEGDANVIEYLVEWRKTGSYTSHATPLTEYELSHTELDLKNNDVVYVRIGAHYKNHFEEDIYKWVDLVPIALASTNYKYYRCTNPLAEVPQTTLFRNVEDTENEDLVLSLYIDE